MNIDAETIASLEHLLSQLLIPDNDIIQAATAQLNVFFTNPVCVPALVHVLGSSANPGVRQYAGVILRSKLIRQWVRLSADVHEWIKASLLQMVAQEPVDIVRHTMAGVVGIIAKYDLRLNGWPQLTQLLFEFCQSAAVAHREVGIYIIRMMCETGDVFLEPHLPHLLQVFAATLGDAAHPTIQQCAVEAMTFLVPILANMDFSALAAATSGAAPPEAKTTKKKAKGVNKASSLAALARSCRDSVVEQLRSLLVAALQYIQSRIEAGDESSAVLALELFDEAIESPLPLVTPITEAVVEFAVSVGKNRAVSDYVRVKALSILSWFAFYKKKALISRSLLVFIIPELFHILSEYDESIVVQYGEDFDAQEDLEQLKHRQASEAAHSSDNGHSADRDGDDDEDDDDDDDEDDDVGSEKPFRVAGQILYAFGMHFPPTHVVPAILSLIQGSLTSPNPYNRKAAMICLQVISEGCGTELESHIPDLLSMIGECLGDMGHGFVREAAVIALAEMSANMQPVICTYAEVIMPRLLTSLNESSVHIKDKACYALGQFCNHLGVKILPFLPTLMPQLCHIIATSHSISVSSMALAAIGAAATAADASFTPYLQDVLPTLFTLLQIEDAKTMELRVQASETMGSLIKAVGREPFGESANSILLQVISGLERYPDDPQLVSSSFAMFASFAFVFKNDLAPYVPSITEMLLKTCEDDYGLEKIKRKDDDEDATGQLPAGLDVNGGDDDNDDNSGYPGSADNGDDQEDAEADDDDDDDSDSDVEEIRATQEFLEEKETAINVIGEICEHCPVAFMPFFERAMVTLCKFSKYHYSEIRKAAVTSLGQFLIALNKLLLPEYAWTPSLPSLVTFVPPQETSNALSVILPRLLLRLQKDTDRLVVTATLDAFNSLLEYFGPALLANGVGELLFKSVAKILRKKARCQGDSRIFGEDSDDEAEQSTFAEEDEEAIAEYDAVLIETASTTLSAIAQAVGPSFAPQIPNVVTLLAPYAKTNATVSEKSMASGTLAEVVDGVGKGVDSFEELILPIFVHGMNDKDDEVCSNSCYGTGLLCLYGGHAVRQHYDSILRLFAALMAEHRELPNVLDNVCGALSRMILAHTDLVPLDSVLHVLAQNLPLRIDYKENEPVFQMILTLLQQQNEHMLKFVPSFVGPIVHVLRSQQITGPLAQSVLDMLKYLCGVYPSDQINALVESLPNEDDRMYIRQILQ